MAGSNAAASRSEVARPFSIRSWIQRHPYIVAGIAIFIVVVVNCWTSYIEGDESLYFLGSRRLADPTFLAADFTWSKLPPTSALFDHLVAPLWHFMDEFAIANLGRLFFWGTFAWALAFFARTAKLPAWSVVAGCLIWLLWGQNLGTCGAPIQGFQVKSFSYPLMLFALAFAIRGECVRAGIAAGLGAAFHIIVGGWAGLAIFLSMLANRKLRECPLYGLAAAPFVLPVIVAIFVFRGAHVPHAVTAKAEDIYALFAMPRCCDVFFFMSRNPLEWVRAAVIFTAAPIAIFLWPEKRAARIAGAFIVALILFFATGVIARLMNLSAFLQLYPFQLANSLPALFLFIFALAGIGAVAQWPRARQVLWGLALAGTSWLVYDHHVVPDLIAKPGEFIEQIQLMSVDWRLEDPILVWIREHTPRNSVFINPYIPYFWAVAERAQVASMRHPPLDQRLIGWKERLEALNGFQPYTQRGIENAKELEVHEARLTRAEIARIRALYGATHYVIKGERPDLAEYHLHSEDGYSVYDLAKFPAP